MQINFDWTISASTVLTVAGSITLAGVSIARIIRRIENRLDRVDQTMRDFPPHRHSGKEIMYPATHQEKTTSEKGEHYG